MSPSPRRYTTLPDSGGPSFEDLHSTLSSPNPIYTASHRLRRRSNAALQMSDVDSEPFTPTPLTPHFDVDRSRNNFFDMGQSPTSSDTMLLTPNGSPTPDETSRAHRPLQSVPYVGLGISHSRHAMESEPEGLQAISITPYGPTRAFSNLDDPFAQTTFYKELGASAPDFLSDKNLTLGSEKRVKLESSSPDKIRKYIGARYYIASEPKTVLPYAPDDKEKLSYLDTRRGILLAMGVFSFLTASAGLWLFTVCSSIFAWFALFTTFVQVHLTIFYGMGFFSKDFDHAAHLQILEEYPLSTEELAPSVDIYLPTCKEPLEVLENTYRHIIRLKYPSSRIKVYVLDDGALDSVRHLCARYGFKYILRSDRPHLKKAGNLRWAFERTQGEFFVIFDADFCPRDDFLLELLPRMKNDPTIAIVQSPQYFRATPEQTWVERGAGSLQEIFYRFIQTNRNKWGAAVCVGSNAVYRRSALQDCGGVVGLASSEDIHTGNYAIAQGWKIDYVPLCLAAGLCPDQARPYFSQQVRWCEGSTSLVFSRAFWKAELTVKQKICFLSGLLYYVASALNIFISPTPALLLLWFKIQYLNYYTLFMGLPSIIFGIIGFRLWSKSTHSMAVQHIDVIQQYAYLSAMVDVVFGTRFNWVPSGEGHAHKSNRYRNYRLVAIGWTTVYQGFFISGVVYRLLTGHAWYYFLPLIILDALQVYISIPFLISIEH